MLGELVEEGVLERTSPGNYLASRHSLRSQEHERRMSVESTEASVDETCDATHQHPQYRSITHRCDKSAGHRNGINPNDKWPQLHHDATCGHWVS